MVSVQPSIFSIPLVNPRRRDFFGLGRGAFSLFWGQVNECYRSLSLLSGLPRFASRNDKWELQPRFLQLPAGLPAGPLLAITQRFCPLRSVAAFRLYCSSANHHIVIIKYNRLSRSNRKLGFVEFYTDHCIVAWKDYCISRFVSISHLGFDS